MSGMARAGMALLLLIANAGGAAAQDGNILMPVDSIEKRLASEPFRVIDRRASRGLDGERTSRTALSFPDGTLIVVKWARAARGGDAFNNSARYEMAAYELQKLFLGQDEYVVPPTVARAFPLAEYARLDAEDVNGRPTFGDTRSIVAVLQYWLSSVTPKDFWDEDRLDADSVYARHFGNFNLLTYLIQHMDSNVGNFLISTVPDNPRVFAVDNGVAFSSVESDRGTTWRRLRVDRLPAATVDRLRQLSRDDLEQSLGTVAEFRVLEDGTLEAAEPTAPMDSGRGVRESDDRIQLGLTRMEIESVWNRVRNVLRLVDAGRLEVF